MIKTYEDYIDIIHSKFPDVARSSIDRICRKGLRAINKIMRGNLELILYLPDMEEMKFYIPMTPEKQDKLDTHNYYRKIKRRKQRDEQKGNSK